MSAIAALRGYRTQFLYSLHYILSSKSDDFIYRLEGEEDLDILNQKGQLLYAIQLKNLGKTITLSDILSDRKTSFIKRFLSKYSEAVPVLVSYGEISKDLKNWNKNNNSIIEKEGLILKKYKITLDEWKLVKTKIKFQEVNEEIIAEEVSKMMKDSFPEIDPIPTIGFLLNWLQLIAEKQQSITAKDFYDKIQDFAKYITERIAIHNQYGLVLKPLHKVSIENVNRKLLEDEFYYATLTRYEHILLGLNVDREEHLEKINNELQQNNVIVLKGASGQGKTALLYSYVNQYANDSLSFELNIQQDAIISQQSIQAIASISKNLDVPAIIVINVDPNTTRWLEIIKESAHFKHIKFLVAIRNEDWYRASSVGVEFLHKEIDLSFSAIEAEIIYSKLNERNKINHFTAFEEAWIQLGDDTPLLEFVYSITQGDSLKNKLKQQVQQILKEEGLSNNQQIEFLRVVSLADSLGAKIEISKLDSNISYQFLIEKLENEYLIKKSSDKKYIQGLHIVRSQKLVEILFDEFTTYKSEYAYKCIPLVAEEDLYLFLLQLFYCDAFVPSQFISDLESKISVNNWGIYTSIVKVFIWLGIREYVENNRNVIDECRAICGDAWIMFVDFIFGSNYNRNEMLDLIKIDDERRKEIDNINERLLPKQNVFNLASEVVNVLPFPKKSPINVFEWRSFGEALFWLKNIPNKKEAVENISEDQFEAAFKIMDSKSLSKLMLGMHTYSSKLNVIRKKYIDYFTQRIKKEFDIIYLSIDEDEVNVHYIIDVLKYAFERATNDYAVGILDIIRTALPDKKKFNSQGHGHRFQVLSADLDETRKTISIESMPLEEWVSINYGIEKLYEYKNRPTNWNEYCLKLNQWETLVNDKIGEFNKCFNELYKGSQTHSPVVPVMQNVFFNWPEKIKAPKSISDPLGIYSGKKRESDTENKKEQLNRRLQSKYEKFLKSFSDFSGSFEIFIQQSAQTLYSKIRLKTEKGHIHNEKIEDLSQTNLFDTINKLIEYNTHYENILGNIDTKHATKVDVNTLLTSATFWRDFVNDNNKGEHSFKRILKLKNDFEERLIKDCKQASKSNPFSIKYINNSQTDKRAILFIDSESPYWSLLGYKEAYNIVQQAINNPEDTSLKSLMLNLWYSNIYFIQTIHGKSNNNRWNEVRLYNIKNRQFEQQGVVNSMPQIIERNIIEDFKIDSWTRLYPDFNEINKASEAYGKLVFLVDHFYDLRSFDELELEESDNKKLKEHIDRISLEIQLSLQSVLDYLVEWINMFPIDETTYMESEEEREYYKAMFSIKDNIYPYSVEGKENLQIIINMKVVSQWVQRLKVCTQSWGIFLLLLSGKYIDLYQKQNGHK